MAYDKRMRRHVLKRRFTVTRTKAVVGFIFSTLFSVVLSTYFEEYGRNIYSQGKQNLFSTNLTEKAKDSSKSKRSFRTDLVLKNAADEKTIQEKKASWDSAISSMRELNSR